MASMPRSLMHGVSSQPTLAGPLRWIYSSYHETRSLGYTGSQFAISCICCHFCCLLSSGSGAGATPSEEEEESGGSSWFDVKLALDESKDLVILAKALLAWRLRFSDSYHGESWKQWRFHSSSSRPTFCNFRETSCNLAMSMGSMSNTVNCQ